MPRIKKKVYRQWIERTEDNLKWVNDNLEEKNYPLICFLAQQSVELILKGYLYFQKHIPLKIHDLFELSKICKKHNLDLSEFKLDLIRLYA